VKTKEEKERKNNFELETVLAKVITATTSVLTLLLLARNL
jgi:hypothetical protein